jgi:hypothetical protein
MRVTFRYDGGPVDIHPFAHGSARQMTVCAVVDDALSPDFPLGDSLEVFIRREDAEQFIAEVRGDDPEVATELRIEERELEAGGLN